MASNAYKVHENTAASLLHYQSYTKPGTTDLSWTRFASANEEFNVASAGGNKFLIKFHANFSKKHLATFSKKEWRTAGEAWLQSQQQGQQGKDAENWQRAQKQLMDNKILKTLGIRSGKADEAKCKRCGHPKSNIPDKSGHSSKTGLCQVPGCDGVTCVGGYLSTYVEGRKDENKPLHDPYEGASGQDSSCIVLNWIPLNEFELAVGNSIVAADPGNALPDSPLPYTHATPFIHLTWTFNGRAGAVRHAKNGAVDVDNGTWCEVGAFKATGGPPGITATWIVGHWYKMG
jgi:hypothetical protein